MLRIALLVLLVAAPLVARDEIAQVETSLTSPNWLTRLFRGARDLRTRMTELKVPGVSVAIIQGGKVVWAKGYGTCEEGKALPVDTNTGFLAGLGAEFGGPREAETKVALGHDAEARVLPPATGYWADASDLAEMVLKQKPAEAWRPEATIGAVPGYRTAILSVGVGQGAVIMTNSDNGQELIAELARSISDTYGWKHVPKIAH